MASDESVAVAPSPIFPAETHGSKLLVSLASEPEDPKAEESLVTIFVGINEETRKNFAEISNLFQSIVKSNTHNMIASVTESLKPAITFKEPMVSYLKELNPNVQLLTNLASLPNFEAINQARQLGDTISQVIEKTAFDNSALNNSLVNIIGGSELTRQFNLQAVFSPIQESLNKQITQFGALIANTLSPLQGYLNSINLEFSKINFDPFWDYIFQSRKGDKEAAARLADHIPWAPNLWQRAAINLKARIMGKSPEEIRLEALTQGVLLVFGGNDDDSFPILVEPESTWVHDSDKALVTICPNELPVSTFWRWVKEEVARAAGLWLVEHPYAGAFVVLEPPNEYWNLRLVKFTASNSENYRLDVSKGRPFGSSIFENREAFLDEVRLAVAQIHNRGNRVTQERVAETLSEKGLLGLSNPERQLRRWTEEFGFRNWSDLMANIK